LKTQHPWIKRNENAQQRKKYHVKQNQHPLDSIIPDKPPIVNKTIKPSANFKGILKDIRPPAKV